MSWIRKVGAVAAAAAVIACGAPLAPLAPPRSPVSRVAPVPPPPAPARRPVGWLGPSQIPTPSGTNTVLQYSGSALSWAAAGGSLGVTGTGLVHVTSGSVDGAANIGTAGQILTTNSGATNTTWSSCSGDVSCSTSTPGLHTVASISGASPFSITPNSLQWLSTAAPVLTEATPLSDVATSPFTITTQAPYASASTNKAPGNFALNIPTPVAGGTHGSALFQEGASTALTLTPVGTDSLAGESGPQLIGAGSASLGITAGGSAKDLLLYNNQYIWMQAKGGSVYLYDSTGVPIQFGLSTSGASSMLLGNSTTFSLSQTAKASTSAGSGAAAPTLSISAQAGQAATGASNNGGAGGDLVLTPGPGGTSGSATAGKGASVKIAGGQKVQITTAVTASTYTADTQSTTADYVIFTDSTSNTIAVTLPAEVAGRCVYVKDKTGKAATHNVTISPASGTIDGAASLVMTKNYDAIYLCSDGTNESIVSEFSSSIVP